MKYDLSVIVPTYNNDKYIERCINSVLKNNCCLQIIVINDGSTDNTSRILDKYDNIEVVNFSSNHGVSFARNSGLKKIKGKYFTFLDSDDYIEANAYDLLFDYACKFDLDMCGCNYYEVNDSIIKSKYIYDGKILNNDELVKSVLLDRLSLVVWNKIYRSDLYKDIMFNESLRVNEDYEYMLRCVDRTLSSMFINDYLYNYCRNYSSLTSRYTCDLISNSNYLGCLSDKFSLYDEYSFYLGNHALKRIHLFSQCVDKKNRYKYLKNSIDRVQLRNLLRHDICFFKKFEIIIFLISIRLHLLFFPLYVLVRKKMRS